MTAHFFAKNATKKSESIISNTVTRCLTISTRNNARHRSGGKEIIGNIITSTTSGGENHKAIDTEHTRESTNASIIAYTEKRSWQG